MSEDYKLEGEDVGEGWGMEGFEQLSRLTPFAGNPYVVSEYLFWSKAGA